MAKPRAPDSILGILGCLKFGSYRKGARDLAAIEFRRLRAGTAWNEVAEGSEQIPRPPQ
jgi:hypothetical protein